MTTNRCSPRCHASMAREPPLSLVEICETQLVGIRSPMSSIGFLTHVHHQWAHDILILTVPLTWSFLGSGLISWGMNLIGPLICLLDLLVPSGSISMAMSASSLLAWSHSEHCLEKDERQRERVRKTKESGILLLSFDLIDSLIFEMREWLSRSMSMFFHQKQTCRIHSKKRVVKISCTNNIWNWSNSRILQYEQKLFDYTVLLSQGQAVASN